MALALRHPARAFWLTALGVLIADQVTKALVRARFMPGDSKPLIDGIFNLTYVRNTGAAFGLLPGRQTLFIGVSVIVLVVVALFWRRTRPTAWPIVIALGLVVGGAVGNLIDRAVLGRVTDFFDVRLFNFAVFNIADSAIVIGVGLLIAWLMFGPEPENPASHIETPGDAEATDPAVLPEDPEEGDR